MIVREMERRPGPGGRLGLGPCELAGWSAGSNVALMWETDFSGDTRFNTKHKEALCDTMC